MFETALLERKYPTATQQARRARWIRYAWIAFLLFITAYYANTMVNLGSLFWPSIVGWIIYLVVIAAIIYQPRFGVFAILFFGLLGDVSLSPWFPFTKNFSSRESILYLNDAFPFSPAELTIAITAIVWFTKMALRRKFTLIMGELFWPAIVFTFFVAVGLIYGLARGGDTNIALWESRPIFYISAMLVLTTNLITHKRHVSALMWFIMSALFIEGLFGTYFTVVTLGFDLSQVSSITEHSAAQHYNTMFVFLLALWLYRRTSLRKRFIIPLMIPPVFITFLATQRRSAFLTLFVGLFLLSFILWKERRGLYYLIVPTGAVLALLYIVAFWNVDSAIGLPAQAIKSVIAEDEANQADANSNLYRDIENLNAAFTIHREPLLGVGFGNKFYIAYPMPDISFFIWWEYIIHNSVIWIWIKTGIFGFLSMVYLVGMSILKAVSTIWRLPSGDLSAIAATAGIYIVMHFIFAYVDMSWSDQSMIYIGTAMGLINSLERIAFPPEQTADQAVNAQSP